MLNGEPMRADQEARGELVHPISHEGCQHRAKDHMAIGGLFHQNCERFAKARLFKPLKRCRVGVAAWRLLDRTPNQQPEQNTGKANDNKGDAPAFNLGPIEGSEQRSKAYRANPCPKLRAINSGKLAAKDRGKHPSQRHAKCVDRHCRCAARRVEIVGNKRLRRRRAPGLSYADTNAKQEQHQEACRKAAKCCEQAPDNHRARDNPNAAKPLCAARDGNTKEGVEHRKGRAAQKAHLPIFKTKGELDRLSQDIDDGAVNEIEDVDRQQCAEHVSSVAGCPKASVEGTCRGCRCCCRCGLSRRTLCQNSLSITRCGLALWEAPFSSQEVTFTNSGER